MVGFLVAVDSTNVNQLKEQDFAALHICVINNFLDGVRLLVINVSESPLFCCFCLVFGQQAWFHFPSRLQKIGHCVLCGRSDKAGTSQQIRRQKQSKKKARKKEHIHVFWSVPDCASRKFCRELKIGRRHSSQSNPIVLHSNRDSLLVTAPVSWSKGCEFETRQERRSSPELTLWTDSYSVSVPTPVLPQWHVRDPGHSAKKCRWQVTLKHADNLDPMKLEWADYAAVQA